MDTVVVTSAYRTPLGAFNGKLKSLTAVKLGSTIIGKIAGEVDVPVDGVHMGCVLSAGLGQSPARQAAIDAGLDHSVNCINVNKICGSGMSAIMLARNAILAEENDVIIAGGMESMTNAPYLLEKARNGYRFGDGVLVDHMLKDGLMDAYDHCVMGNFAEDTAAACHFTRENQDSYTVATFLRARQAIEDGSFLEEIVPVTVIDRKNEVTVEEDEIPFSVDLTKMKTLKAAFRENGTITAASASSISDGAAAVMLMKESMARQLRLAPLARIVAQSCFSLSPRQFATAPIGAIRQVLQRSGWSIEDLDLMEINEAFAVVPMAATRELGLNPEKINVFGGACALGHPLGASGARIVVTLLNAMKSKKARRGLATLCVGGGEGVAMTFEMA
ncbi:MAG: thiolase family protein [Holosporaceae bacterium]|nr:thiolase family protein [Holosporaceae bacterium]